MRIYAKTKILLVCLVIILLSACSTQITLVATSTPQPTQTPQPTITPTHQTYSVTFIAFHDYNGNGNQDDGEPLLEGILNNISAGECTTGEDGRCEIAGVPAGEYNVSIQSPSNFKYLTQSINEDIQLKDGLDVNINESTDIAEPIVEGPYRSPFHNLSKLIVRQWKDINMDTCWGVFPDRSCDLRRDWLGGQNTYDGHDGTDFEIGANVEVYAMREGYIDTIKSLDNNEGFEVRIRDSVPYNGNGNSWQMFYHINKLNESLYMGQTVTPNTLLGVGGSTKIGGTIHIGIFYSVPSSKDPESIKFQINPYIKCPFQEELWTGIAALSSKLIERNEISGKYTTLNP